MTTPAIHIAFDGLSAVDGSARFSFGTITALASVSGPVAPRPATEHPVRASIDVHVRPLAAVPGTRERQVAAVLRGILERTCILVQHPRTAVQVVVQTLSPPPPSPSGSGTDQDLDLHADVRLATQINAACLALLNAGSVPMRGVVCAVAVAATAQPASAGALQPQLVTEPGRGGRPLYSGCFAFLFGVDATHTDASVEGAVVTSTAASVPPAKMIWTNYRAKPGHAFSATALALAEQIALEGAAVVWIRMKEGMPA